MANPTNHTYTNGVGNYGAGGAAYGYSTGVTAPSSFGSGMSPSSTDAMSEGNAVIYEIYTLYSPSGNYTAFTVGTNINFNQFSLDRIVVGGVTNLYGSAASSFTNSAYTTWEWAGSTAVSNDTNPITRSLSVYGSINPPVISSVQVLNNANFETGTVDTEIFNASNGSGGTLEYAQGTTFTPPSTGWSTSKVFTQDRNTLRYYFSSQDRDTPATYDVESLFVDYIDPSIASYSGTGVVGEFETSHTFGLSNGTLTTNAYSVTPGTISDAGATGDVTAYVVNNRILSWFLYDGSTKTLTTNLPTVGNPATFTIWSFRYGNATNDYGGSHTYDTAFATEFTLYRYSDPDLDVLLSQNTTTRRFDSAATSFGLTFNSGTPGDEFRLRLYDGGANNGTSIAVTTVNSSGEFGFNITGSNLPVNQGDTQWYSLYGRRPTALGGNNVFYHVTGLQNSIWLSRRLATPSFTVSDDDAASDTVSITQNVTNTATVTPTSIFLRQVLNGVYVSTVEVPWVGNGAYGGNFTQPRTLGSDVYKYNAYFKYAGTGSLPEARVDAFSYSINSAAYDAGYIPSDTSVTIGNVPTSPLAAESTSNVVLTISGRASNNAVRVVKSTAPTVSIGIFSAANNTYTLGYVDHLPDPGATINYKVQISRALSLGGDGIWREDVSEAFSISRESPNQVTNFSPEFASYTEGADTQVNFNFNIDGALQNTYYWKIFRLSGTNEQEFSTATSGSVTLPNTSFSVGIINNTTDETASQGEIFNAQLYTDSGYTQSIATSSQFVLYDNDLAFAISAFDSPIAYTATAASVTVQNNGQGGLQPDSVIYNITKDEVAYAIVDLPGAGASEIYQLGASLPDQDPNGASTSNTYQLRVWNGNELLLGPQFTVVRSAGDTAADPFDLGGPVTNVELSTDIFSNTITVSGLEAIADVTISDVTTGSPTYSKNEGAFTSLNGTAVNGDTFQVRVTSSDSNNTSVTATLSIGGTADSFTATTVASGGSGSGIPSGSADYGIEVYSSNGTSTILSPATRYGSVLGAIDTVVLAAQGQANDNVLVPVSNLGALYSSSNSGLILLASSASVVFDIAREANGFRLSNLSGEPQTVKAIAVGF